MEMIVQVIRVVPLMMPVPMTMMMRVMVRIMRMMILLLLIAVPLVRVRVRVRLLLAGRHRFLALQPQGKQTDARRWIGGGSRGRPRRTEHVLFLLGGRSAALESEHLALGRRASVLQDVQHLVEPLPSAKVPMVPVRRRR